MNTLSQHKDEQRWCQKRKTLIWNTTDERYLQTRRQQQVLARATGRQISKKLLAPHHQHQLLQQKKKKNSSNYIFFYSTVIIFFKQLHNTIQKMIANRVITYGANASHGNPNPVKHIHNFLQIKMRKYGENSKSTSRDWLNNTHLQKVHNQ